MWTALHRRVYCGEVVYAQTAKRDKWGQKRQAARPESEWIRLPAPALQIVTPDAWTAAHARIDAARAVYMKGTQGQAFGRPALGNPSKYLLTNARPIVSSLLIGRVTFAALDERHRWRVTGGGTLSGLFDRIFSTTAVGSTSPTGDAATYFELPIVGDTRRAP